MTDKYSSITLSAATCAAGGCSAPDRDGRTMMSEAVAAHVQQPTLRGQQSVAAIWFPRDWFDPITLARRIVECAAARRDSAALPGKATCSVTPPPSISIANELPDGRCDKTDVLSSAALRKQELAHAPAGDVLIVSGSRDPRVSNARRRSARSRDLAEYRATGAS